MNISYSSVDIWKTCSEWGIWKHFTDHIKTTAKCIPTKPRAKCRVPWEATVIRGKRDNMKIASLLNKTNPTNDNA